MPGVAGKRLGVVLRVGRAFRLIVTGVRGDRQGDGQNPRQLVVVPRAAGLPKNRECHPTANDRGYAVTSSFTSMPLTSLPALGALRTNGTQAPAAAAEHIKAEDPDPPINTRPAHHSEQLIHLTNSSTLKEPAQESTLKPQEPTRGAGCGHRTNG
ncbi:hypothetical protein [Streptomyces sp. NPDC017991]|uniref:hypothetical protein n=1 Tax=Streptomyces sp. NPDC017991 TaxID=3365026 RepID=UPI0037979682